MMDQDTKTAILHCVGYITSDSSIAAFYGVKEREVASLRRERHEPRKMMQHKPIEDRSITKDDLAYQDTKQRGEAHLSRLWGYYASQGGRWGLSREEYAVLVHSNLGVSRETALALAAQRRSVVIG